MKASQSIWESLINLEPFASQIELNADRTGGIVRAVHAEIPENDFAIELGEMFYQLRASLDCAVYKAAVLAEGFDPPSDENRVEFPIYSVPKQFKSNPVNRPKFPKKLRDWLELIQPYNVTKAANTDFANLSSYLGFLHECARKDRHRKLHVVAAVPSYVGYEFVPADLVSVNFVRILGDTDFFKGKDDFLAFDLAQSAAGYKGKLHLNTRLVIEISIENFRPTAPGQAGYVFGGMLDAVKLVIDYFENFFA
jgi:hypothetical protein